MTTLTYNALDRLVSLTDAAGNVWTYEYDVLGGFLPAHLKRFGLKMTARLRVVMATSIVVQIGLWFDLLTGNSWLGELCSTTMVWWLRGIQSFSYPLVNFFFRVSK